MYKVIASRKDIAIYYGWEYGIAYANKLLKELVAIRPGLYEVRALTGVCLKQKRSAETFCQRIRETVLQHKARMNHQINNTANVWVTK